MAGIVAAHKRTRQNPYVVRTHDHSMGPKELVGSLAVEGMRRGYNGKRPRTRGKTAPCVSIKADGTTTLFSKGRTSKPRTTTVKVPHYNYMQDRRAKLNALAGNNSDVD